MESFLCFLILCKIFNRSKMYIPFLEDICCCKELSNRSEKTQLKELVTFPFLIFPFEARSRFFPYQYGFFHACVGAGHLAVLPCLLKNTFLEQYSSYAEVPMWNRINRNHLKSTTVSSEQ